MSNRIVAPARQAGIRFLGSLKGLQIRALVGPKHCRVVAEGRRGKDDRKQNTLAPLIRASHAHSMYDIQRLCLYVYASFLSINASPSCTFSPANLWKSKQNVLF
jgi:hypothetical protein